MTVDEFNRLDEQSKKIYLFEADKIAERYEGVTKIQLFKIDNFIIETRANTQTRPKRDMAAYALT